MVIACMPQYMAVIKKLSLYTYIKRKLNVEWLPLAVAITHTSSILQICRANNTAGSTKLFTHVYPFLLPLFVTSLLHDTTFKLETIRDIRSAIRPDTETVLAGPSWSVVQYIHSKMGELERSRLPQELEHVKLPHDPPIISYRSSPTVPHHTYCNNSGSVMEIFSAYNTGTCEIKLYTNQFVGHTVGYSGSSNMKSRAHK